MADDTTFTVGSSVLLRMRYKPLVRSKGTVTLLGDGGRWFAARSPVDTIPANDKNNHPIKTLSSFAEGVENEDTMAVVLLDNDEYGFTFTVKVDSVWRPEVGRYLHIASKELRDLMQQATYYDDVLYPDPWSVTLHPR